MQLIDSIYEEEKQLTDRVWKEEGLTQMLVHQFGSPTVRVVKLH